VLALMAEYLVLCAVATGKADLVAAPVAKGCNMNETDQGGMTALALACVKVGNMEKLSWGGASADEAPHGLAVGRWVRATVTFTTNSKNAKEGPKGSLGVVAEIDQDGDASIGFEGLDKEWVLKSNFGNISVLSQEDVLKERAQREEVLVLSSLSLSLVAMLIAPTQAAGALNEANNEGATPLMHASLRGLCGVVELLLAAGADVATKDEDGFTALMLACKEKKEEAAALLMEATMNAGALDVQHTKYKLSALHYASSSGLESIVAKLLSLGADVALKDKEGNSCLHIAAAQGSNAILRILLNAGAKITAKNKYGNGALDHTKEIKDEEKRAAVLALIVEYLVLCAVATGKGDLVAAPVAKGCNMNETDQCGKTALDVATNDEVKAALRQHGARHSLFYAAEEGMLELVRGPDQGGR